MTRRGMCAFGIGVLGWMGMVLAAAPAAMAYKSGIIGKQNVQVLKGSKEKCQELAKIRGVKIQSVKGKNLLNAAEVKDLGYDNGDGGLFVKSGGNVVLSCDGGYLSL